MNPDNNKRVPLTGYSDCLSARPGESVQFKLSAHSFDHAAELHSAESEVHTWLTQCICADPNPQGPGIIEKSADQWYTPGTVKAKQQDFQAGSYAISEPTEAFNHPSNIVIKANIWPTLDNHAIQSIVSFGTLSLCIDADGKVALHIDDEQIACTQPIKMRCWTHVSANLQNDADGLSVMVQCSPLHGATSHVGEPVHKRLPSNALGNICSQSLPVVIAAQWLNNKTCHCFNGKIESPEVSLTSSNPATAVNMLWNFSSNMTSCTVPGANEYTPPLTLVNYPARAMTGSQWKGQEMAWRHAPDLYGAIHFHEDDIVDFEWDTTFTLQIPDGMPSGVYIMHTRLGEHEDAMPFYVCAPAGKPQNKLCVLIPTFTYAIYGNHARPDWQPSWQEQVRQWNAYPYNPAEYPGYGLSTYNYHSDGSGICHASHRRPLFNLRPGYITFANTPCSGLRHFQADSHLLAWLEHHQIEFDVVTDRELHNEGAAAITGYSHVMTTSHPEYHTAQTLDALTQYRDSGGHLSYLGGNGFYWRIALHPENDNTLEIRRAEDGIRAWAAEPGEYYQAFDGQYGGLWRRNGRPPQALCGLGFSAQGQFSGSYYRRHPVDGSMSWIFEGIDDEMLGDFGLCGGGAAGFELDRADERLGTPAQAVVLATSENHSEDFILVPEEMLTHLTTLPGLEAKELLHANIIWFDTLGGGSVFSTGSITFCGSLPHNNFDNNISQLLLNVVRRISA